jgi:4-amino-4-deoxy-L-arabinose transferase-like glycosyltransferase
VIVDLDRRPATLGTDLRPPTPFAADDEAARPRRVIDGVSVALLSGVLALLGAVHAIGLSRAPGLIDDEGTYVAQAWAVITRGTLSHYTFWYDHPPLGWIQLAGWFGIVDGFRGGTMAVVQGRTFMLVAFLVSAALLYVLARRLDFGRVAAAAGVVLFGLSPLALAQQRMVLLDNLAVPWLLAALVLAASPKRSS